MIIAIVADTLVIVMDFYDDDILLNGLTFSLDLKVEYALVATCSS